VEPPEDAVRRCRDGVSSDGVSLPVVSRDGLSSAAVPPATSSADNRGAGVISGDGSSGCTRSVERRGGAGVIDAAGEPAMGVSAGGASRWDSLEGLLSHK